MHRFPVVFGLAEFWSWKHCLQYRRPPSSEKNREKTRLWIAVVLSRFFLREEGRLYTGWHPDGGGTPGNSWWGCAARFSKSWADFRPKNVIIHTCFHTSPLGRNYVIFIRLGRKYKNYSNPFRIRIYLFLSYSFGIETIKMFIHSRSSLGNAIRFQTKTAQKLYPILRHIPIWLI